MLKWYSEDFRKEKLEKFIAFCYEGSFSIDAVCNEGFGNTFEFVNVNGKQFVIHEIVFPKILELAESFGWPPWDELYDLHMRLINNVEAKELAFSLRNAMKEIPQNNLYQNLGGEYERFLGKYSKPSFLINFDSMIEKMECDISPIDFYQISFIKQNNDKINQIKNLFTTKENSLNEQTCQLLIWFSNDLLKDKLLKFIAFCEEHSFVIYNENCIKIEECDEF